MLLLLRAANTSAFTMNKEKMKTISLVLLFFLITSPALAYMEDYPPFQESEKRPKAFPTQRLPAEFQDGDLTVRTFEGHPDSVRPFVTDVSFKGELVWNSENGGYGRTLYGEVADLNGDGLKDVFVVSGPAAPNTLAVYINVITVFLKNMEKRPNILQYETMSFEADQDILDLNGDGKAEFLKCDLVQDVESLDGKTHSYWLYNIYELKGDQLALNNSLWLGFPKFIQYTHKPNDKPTKKVSKAVQQQYASPKVPKIITVDTYKLAHGNS